MVLVLRLISLLIQSKLFYLAVLDKNTYRGEDITPMITQPQPLCGSSQDQLVLQL